VQERGSESVLWSTSLHVFRHHTKHMARRMFSPKIISSARFLKMPIDSQLLYFHLGMNADDDGIVEAYTIIKSIGSNEDNLRVLSSKGFIKILNEDLVSFITDWTEHNLIRADRKVDSIYKPLLLQILPEVELIDPKPRADTGKMTGRPMDDQWTDNGQPMDGIGKDRIGKDKLGKESKGKDTDTEPQKAKVEKLTFGEMEKVKLTQEEYDKLIGRIGEKNTHMLIFELDTYIASKGAKYQSHYATLLNWAKRKAVDQLQKAKVEQTNKKRIV
jgi:hypothetical protein